MEYLVNLKSDSEISEKILTLSNGKVQVKNSIGAHPYKSLIDEIDEYCTSICRFLSASNWTVAYRIMQKKMLTIRTCNAEENEVIPCIDIFEMIYLDKNTIEVLFHDLWGWISSLRNPLHQSLLLYFLSSSLQYWIFALPGELYEAGKDGSSIQLVSSSLFDYIHTNIESSKYIDGSIRFLTILLCCFPSTFKTFTSSIKRFTTNSKKLKFLSFLNSSLQSPSPSDNILFCFSIIISAASGGYNIDNQYPISEYAVLNHEKITVGFGSTFSLNSDARGSLITIACDLFVSFALINIKYPMQHLEVFHQPEVTSDMACCFTSGLRALAEIDSAAGICQSLIDSVSIQLRDIICKQSHLLLKARAAGNSLRKSLSSQTESVSIPILTNTLQCFISNPLSYFNGCDDTEFATQIGAILDPIVTCLLDSDKGLSDAATGFLFSFVEEKTISQLPPIVNTSKHPAIAIYMAGFNTIASMSERLTEMELNDPKFEAILLVIKNSLFARVTIAKRFHLKETCYDIINQMEMEGAGEKMYTNFETAILIALCSPDIEIFKITIQAISYALEGCELFSENIQYSPLLYNRHQYNEFHPDSFTITGNAILQKRIRELASQFTTATDGIMNAWEIIYERYSAAAKQQQTSKTFVVESRNYLGMLASLSECILATDDETNVRVSTLTPMIHDLAQNTLYLLESPNMLISNSAKEVLSTEFGNHLTHDIFLSLNQLINTVVQSKNKEQILRISDLFISLINGVINRCVQGKMNIERVVPSTLYYIMKYLGTFTDTERDTLRLKIRCIKLATKIRSNDKLFNVKPPQRDLHNFLSLMLNWFDWAALRNDDYDTTSFPYSEKKENEIDRLLADLALEVAKGATYMAKGLVIYTPPAISEEDYLQAKSTVCANFFSIGVRALEKYSSAGDSFASSSRNSIAAKTMNSTSKNSDILSEGLRSTIAKYNNTICKYFIDILSSILTMNTDVGLKFALPLGYHKNQKVRSAFVNIFATILKDSAGAKDEGSTDFNLEALVNYLKSNLSIAVLLCDSCPATEVDSLASALLNLFMTDGMELDLIKAAVKREIQGTTRVVELLRRNSVATRMLTLYARKVGTNYLSSTLAPVLQLFLKDPSNHVFELSSDKIEGKNVSENIRKFMKCLSSFSTAFIQSLNNMPPSFKEICYTIRTEADKKFPDASATSVGAFLFLRFFCPAIVAPESNGLSKERLRRDVRRSLLLVAKIIQNMANGSLYSLKLPLLRDKMGDLNAINAQITQYLIDAAIITGNNYDLSLELSKISIVSKGSNSKPDNNSKMFDKGQALFIHQFVFNYSEIIIANAATPDEDLFFKGSDSESLLLPSLSSSTIDNTHTLKAFGKLQELVEVIGQPKQNKSYQIPEEISSDNTEQGTQLYNFMARNSTRDFGSILEKRMVNEGVTTDGAPFIILSLGSFDKDTIIEPDIITYRIFQILCKLWNSPYSFFIDCTGFSENNFVDVSIFENLFTLSPLKASKNCGGFMFFNCSSAFLPNLDVIISMAERSNLFNPSFIPYTFICSFDEQISRRLHGLSKKTRAIFYDEKNNYSDVLQFDNSAKDFVPVDMKVGREYVHVCKVVPVPIVCGGKTVNIKLYDTYHVTAIKGAVTSHKIGQDAFVINFNDHTSHLQVYSSPQRNEIVRNVNDLVTQFNTDSSSTSLSDSPTLNLQDVISIIGNIGMFGLNAEDNETRNGAYNIMAALVHLYFHMDFEIGQPRDGIYVPPYSINHFSGIWDQAGKNLSEWCYPYCKCFTDIFLDVDYKMQSAAIFIVEYWTRNIYKVVHQEDKKNGRSKAKTLIRNFVNIINGVPKYIGIFNICIWDKLFEDKELIPVVVDIVIAAAIDKQESGESCDDIISILLLRNPNEVFKRVIDKAMNITHVPVDAEDEAEKAVYSSISWNEVIVYLKAMNSLLFDALELAWNYLPEICFLGSMFTNNGPYEVKLNTQQLAICAFSTFSSVEGLSIQASNGLNMLLEQFTSTRGNYLFGVSSKTDTDENLIHTATMLETFPEIIGGLLAIFDIAAGNDEAKKKEWKSKWTAYVMDESFKEHSIVRSRAISVLGILIEEYQAEKVIIELESLLEVTSRMVRNNDPRAIDMNLCIIFCAGKVALKLPPSSTALPILFWQGMCSSQFPFTDYFITCTNLSANALRKITEADSFDGDIVGVLTRARSVLEPYSKEFDDIVGVKYSPEMFDNYISSLLCRGLCISATQYHTLNIMEVFLKARIKSDELYNANNSENPLSKQEMFNLCIYGCYLFLFARSSTESKKFLSHFKEGNKSLDIGYGVSVPQYLSDYFCCGSDQSIVSLHSLSTILSSKHVEDSLFQKGILWNSAFLAASADLPELREIIIGMIFLYLPKVLHTMDHSVNQPLIEQCQKLSSVILTAPEFSGELPNEYVTNLTIIPQKYGLDKVNFTGLLDGKDNITMVGRLIDLFVDLQIRSIELIGKEKIF